MSQTVRCRLRLVAALGAGLLFTSCGSERPTAIIDNALIDSSLPGTWAGTLDGGGASNSYGSANITMVLKADSTFTGESDNPLYCSLNNATWSVKGTQFSAGGIDCTGTSVKFAAPVPTTPRLTGTWTASSGRAGTFTLAKKKGSV